MEKTKGTSANGREEQTEVAEERKDRANETYCRNCAESGLKVSAWQDFPAWMAFVEGQIEETQLAEQARTEVEQFARVFGKYVIIEKEEAKPPHEEDEKKKRAKRANKIYRQVCGEVGMTVCFFHDFNSWSQYVEGKIGEEEFLERVKQEVKAMAARMN